MLSLPALDIRPLLTEIASISELRIEKALEGFATVPNVNQGAVDNRYLSDQLKRTAFFEEAERIAAELNALGHKLLPLDQDNDLVLDSTSVSWATDWPLDSPCGLDFEIFPGETRVLWIISPNG
jgi:hypothetical protein